MTDTPAERYPERRMSVTPREVLDRLACALAGITDDEPGKVARRMQRICYDKERIAALVPVAELMLRDLGAVFPDPALLQAVAEAEARKERHHFGVRKHEPHSSPVACTLHDCACPCADCDPAAHLVAAYEAIGRAVAELAGAGRG